MGDFKRLSDIVGVDSIGWRYDPIFVDDKHAVEALIAGTLEASGEANCDHHDHEEAHGHACGHGRCHE